MKENFFPAIETERSRENSWEEKKKILRRLLLVFTLLAGEELPVDTRPPASFPETGLRRSEDAPEDRLSRTVREYREREKRLRPEREGG